jgi:hypothetical protein
MDNPIMAILDTQRGGTAASTTSLDLPPALLSILSQPAPGAAPAPAAPAPMTSMTGLSSGMGTAPPGAASPRPLPAYQDGGMIGAGGSPVPPTAGVSQSAPQGPADPQVIAAQTNQFVSQNPQQVEEIRQMVMRAMQIGELTPQELNMMVQLTSVAASNPDMYPQIRQFAIQNGLATDADLPQEYDAGLVATLQLVAKSVQQGMGGQDMTQGGSPATMQSLKAGGTVEGKEDGPVPIMAHEGEYVIPKNVVQMKGKEFFDNLVEKYKDVS